MSSCLPGIYPALCTFSWNCFYSSRKGLDFQEAQPSLRSTKWFLLSEMRTSNILQNLSVWMGLRATSKGLWAFVVVWFFSCNRLWNGSWHCFSCDIVAWIGTAGLWDSPLMSAPQHPLPAVPCTILWAHPPCLRKDTMCRCAIKVISSVERLLLKGRQDQSKSCNVEARETLWKGQRETKSGERKNCICFWYLPSHLMKSQSIDLKGSKLKADRK